MDVSIPEAYCGDDQRPTLGLCAARDAGASKYVLTTWALEDAADAARVLDDAFADLLDKWCEARSKDVTDAATGERVRRRGALPRKIVFWRSGRVGASDYAKIERDEPPAIRLAFERYAASHPDATPVVVPQIAFIATSKSAGVKVTVSFRLKGVAVLELCLLLARAPSLSRALSFSRAFSRFLILFSSYFHSRPLPPVRRYRPLACCDACALRHRLPSFFSSRRSCFRQRRTRPTASRATLAPASSSIAASRRPARTTGTR